MKRFILSICFVAFLSAGLVSCNDQAAEVTPNYPDVSNQYGNTGDNGSESGGGPKKP